MRMIKVAPRLALWNGELIIEEMIRWNGPLRCGWSAITKWRSLFGEAMPVLLGINQVIPFG